MPIRRVLVVWSNPLFQETVCLLLDHPEVEVMKVNSEHAAAQVEIESLQPDIIIIEETEGFSVAGTEALQILEASPWESRLIRLSLQDNELWMYHRERRMVEQAEDLLNLILNV